MRLAKDKREFFEGFSDVLKAHVKDWEEMSTEPRFVDGEWVSVYKRKQIKCTSGFVFFASQFLTLFTVPTQANIVRELLAAEHKDSSSKHSPHSAVEFVQEGMRLQRQQ